MSYDDTINRRVEMRDSLAVSVRRYNSFIGEATDELKLGGDVEKAKVWATLALAEATLLSEK